jgi:hypothetical protein
MKARRRIAALSILVLLTIAGCAAQPYVETPGAPGFFHGLLHGFIAWFALIGHLFDHHIRVYAYPNNGGWYDFGFLIGASAWGGGAGASAR